MEHMCHATLKIKCFKVRYSQRELTTALAVQVCIWGELTAFCPQEKAFEDFCYKDCELCRPFLFRSR